jgi:hypothetical protein
MASSSFLLTKVNHRQRYASVTAICHARRVFGDASGRRGESAVILGISVQEQ